MSELVLFGVGSPIVVDYEETCRRLGVRVVACIQNRAGQVFVLDRTTIRQAHELDESIRRVPCLCPLFTPLNRRTAVAEASELGFPFAHCMVDPTSIIASSTVAGDGSYINAGCVIGSACIIGAQVVINRGVSIGHNTEIADFSSVGPSAVLAGEVRIGGGALIGAGAVVLPRIRIGQSAVVGAGSVVTRDVPAGRLVFGNPARLVPTAGAEFK